MIVDSIMHRGVLTVPAERTVREAARAMREARVGCLVVTERGDAVGMVTERDLAYRVVAAGKDPDATRVAEIMTKPLATVEPSAQVEEAASQMKALGIKRLVVVMDREIRGLITVTDIAYAQPDHTRRLLESWVKPTWQD